MSAREQFVNRISQHFGGLPDALRKRRWLVGIVFLGFLALCVFGLSKLRMDMTIEGWFNKKDPTLIAFHRYHEEFGSEDGLYIIYKPKNGDVFSHEALEAVRGIQNELIDYRVKLKPGEQSALDHIVKINTLVNAPVLTVDGDTLVSKPLVGSKVPNASQELDAIRKIAEAQKQFPLQFFSRDYKYGGIHIETDFGAIPIEDDVVSDDMTLSMDPTAEGVGTGEAETPVEFKPTDMADYYALYEEIKKIINKPEYAKHLEYYAVGNTAAAEHDLKMAEEMGNLYMAALVIIIVLLWFLFRSASAVVWSILIVILSTVFTLGVAGLTGLTVTGFLILTVLLILTVGIADSVHMLTSYTHLRKDNVEHQEALRRTYKYTGVALLLTGLTNMVGTMALNITPVVPIQNFAIMSTLGILFALLLTIYLLPILVDIWPTVPKTIKPGKADKKPFLNFMPVLGRMLDKIVPMVEKRPIAIIAPFMLLLVFSIYGATQVKVNTQILDQYPEDSIFTKSVIVADEHMMGAYSMVLYLDFKEDFALQDPEVLKAMEELQNTFETKYSKYVVMTNSVVDVVKDANQKLNGGAQTYYSIPETREVLAQTLFLFNSANPSERQRLVDDNYRKVNIKIALHSYGSYEYYGVMNQMRVDIDQMMAKLKVKYPKTEVSITGIFALAMQASQYITENQAISFGIAIAVVSVILLLVFGSVKVGLIALIPNLIPAFLTLGLLGLFGITLDFYTMMLAPIIIGISIDDTVHFISQYQRQLAKDGDVNAALRRTMSEAGRSVVFTSLILGLGFGIMSIASAAGTSNMGKFGALAIMMGLLNDLFLLPALLLTFKGKFKGVLGTNENTHQVSAEEGAK
jgi:uncharacterized protein